MKSVIRHVCPCTHTGMLIMAGSARTFSLFPFVSSSLAQGPRQSRDIQQTFWVRLAYVVPALKNLPALGTHNQHSSWLSSSARGQKEDQRKGNGKSKGGKNSLSCRAGRSRGAGVPLSVVL